MLSLPHRPAGKLKIYHIIYFKSVQNAVDSRLGSNHSFDFFVLSQWFIDVYCVHGIMMAPGLCSGGIMAALLALIAELLPAKGRGFYLTVWSCGRPMLHDIS